MIPTTNAYKEAIKDNRILHNQVKIIFSDGSTKTVEDAGLFQFSITDEVSNSGSFDIGSAIAKQLVIRIDNTDGSLTKKSFSGAELRPRSGLEINGKTEWLDKGAFHAEPGRDTGDIITVSAFDEMISFDQPYIKSKLEYPATLREILQDACSCCDVKISPDTAVFDNSDFVVDARPDDSSLTFRQVVQWVAQIACKYARINNAGQLTLQWYRMELLDQEASDLQENTNVVKMNTLKSGSLIETDDVVITGIRVTEESKDSEASGTETVYQYGEDGYVLEVTGNRLVQGGKGNRVAEYLGKKLNGLRFRPLNVICQSDPSVESGDIGLVTDRKNNMYKTIVTGTQYNGGGTQSFTCSAESPVRKALTRYSEATRLHKEFLNGLSQNKTEWEKAIEDLKDAMITGNGLYPFTETLEDGSMVLYFGDKPTLEESTVLIKFNAKGWAMSTNGGESWNIGALVDGEMITKILNTIGLNADWINTGAFVVKDAQGQVLFRADTDAGRVDIVADTFSLKGKTIDEIAQNKLNAFINNVYTPEIEGIQAQVDGQVETFYYDYEPTLQNIPASQWTTESDRQKHMGDLFFWKSKGFSYRFLKDGYTWKWQLVKDTDVTKALTDAADALDTADSKRRVFVSTPQPPYEIGDLWVQGSNGDIMRCQTSRTSGSYSSYDWVKASKYTDDTALNTFINGEFKQQIEALEQQADKKAETWYQSTDPSYSWSTSEMKTEHIGDMWYNTGTQRYYRWNGSSWVELTIQPPSSVFDSIDGKAQIFVSQPKPPYHKGDLWATSTQNGQAEIKICIYERESGYYSASDWIDTKYVDISDVNGAINKYDTSLGQTEVFNKLTNGGQNQGIYLQNGMLYINANYILAGTLAGKYINAKGISVKNIYNQTTFSIDDSGNVNINASTFSLSGNAVATESYVSNKTAQVLSEAKIYADQKTGNLLKGSDLSTESLNQYWNTSGSIMQGQSDPDGGTKAVRLYGTSGDCFISARYSNNNPVKAKGQYEIRVWLKSNTSRTIVVSLNRVSYSCALTSTWKQFRFTAPVTTPNTQGYENFTIGGFASIGSGAYVYVYNPEVVHSYSPADILAMLTNNGAMDGIYMYNNQLYVKGKYIDVDDLKALNATIGGFNIGNISIANGCTGLTSKTKGVYIGTNGLRFYSSDSNGRESSFTFNTSNGSFAIVGAAIKLGDSRLSYDDGALTVKYGLHVYATRSGDFGDGSTGEIIFKGLPATSGGTHLVRESGTAIIAALSSSSKRYKDHIAMLKDAEAEKLLDIPVVWFKYKEGYLVKGDRFVDKPMPGFYAEDVYRAFPECAMVNPDTSVEDWNYRTLIPPMLKLIQNLYKEIKELKENMS